MIQSAIQRVESGCDLSMDEVVETFDQIISGCCAEDDIARWLLALNRKGPSVSEVAGAAMALRRKMTPIRSSRPELLDTCGTGGDQSHTFNISTAAALVTAAAGVPVAKHGNRAASSRSGSADVMAVLGVNVEADVACVERLPGRVGHLLLLCSPVARRHEARRPGAEETGRADHLQHPRPPDQSGRGVAAVARRRPGETPPAAGRGPGPAGHRAQRGRPRQRRPGRGHAYRRHRSCGSPPARCGISPGPPPTSDWKASN